MTFDCDAIIADRLWVGTCLRPEDVRQLKNLEVTSVVCLQSDSDIAGEGTSARKLLKAFSAAEIKFLRVAINDFDKEDLLRNIPRCVAEIEEALRPPEARVYLHCTAGLNRAPTVAAAYLMRARGMSPKEAYDYVLARRYCRPYLDVLQNYAASLKKAEPGL